MPGRSFSGKTTLVRELVRAGATYYSDDYAVFDARGRVHPFPRQLSIRRNGAHVQERHPVESLGGVAGEMPLPVGLVAVTEYDARVPRLAAATAFGRPGRARAARRTPWRLGEGPKRCSRRSTESPPNAQVLKGRRGEAERVATRILERAS